MNGWWLTLWDHAWWPMQWIAVLTFAVIAATTDCRTRRIPNLLTGPAILAGFCWSVTIGGFAGFVDSFTGAAVAMLPFVLMFVFAGGGAGDAKLMAAIGAWVGVIGGLMTVAAVMIAGGLLAVVFIVVQKNWRDVAANFHWILDSLRTALFGHDGPRRAYVLPAVHSLHTMPYGLAILAGTCFASGGAWLCHG
jgi:prepilin peptidase CpaA